MNVCVFGDKRVLERVLEKGVCDEPARARGAAGAGPAYNRHGAPPWPHPSPDPVRARVRTL